MMFDYLREHLGRALRDVMLAHDFVRTVNVVHPSQYGSQVASRAAEQRKAVRAKSYRSKPKRRYGIASGH